VTYEEDYYPRARWSARLPGIEGSYAYSSEPGAVLGMAPGLILWPEDGVVTDGAGTMPAVCPLMGGGARRGSVMPDTSQLVESADCKRNSPRCRRLE
jgi:hypothetical protein